MLKLTDEQLDWLVERIPDHAPSPKGGRPPLDKRKAMQGIFWILDNGAKWKDLPRRFGSKSAVHRWFKRWVEDRVFENIMRDAGRFVEERDGYRRRRPISLGSSNPLGYDGGLSLDNRETPDWRHKQCTCGSSVCT